MRAHGESWCWIYEDGRQDDVWRSACSLADHCELAFDWRDAKVVAEKLRQAEADHCLGEE